MSSRSRFPACLGVLLILLVFSAGCTSVEVGDAQYTGGNISVGINSTGSPSEGYVQVTVYTLRDNRQEESGVFFAPLRLEPGTTTAQIPGTLEPGRYKLYFYVIQNGERKAAAIRDIVVS